MMGARGAGLALALLVGACGGAAKPVTGYVEAEFIYVAPPEGGWLTELGVTRGAEVVLGQTLFKLESAREEAMVREARERLAQAEAQLDDLLKGRRPEEIAALRARLKEAEAALALAKADKERWSELVARGVAAVARADQVDSGLVQARARVEGARRDIEVAALAARPDAIAGARAAREAAAAALAQAEWRLDQRKVVARAAGRVEDVYFRPGELVPAGQPVLALLAPENLKLRFFVPQERLDAVAIGAEIEAKADALAAPVKARISFVASEAEFTPPVLYGPGSRKSLVFLVEAEPLAGAGLRPGQPIDVRLP